MSYEVNLTDLPRDSFGFVAYETAKRIRAHNSMMDYFYKHFDLTKNLKQLMVYQTLADPTLPTRTRNRVQHVCLRGSVGSGKSTMGIAWPMMMLHRHAGSTWLGMRRTDAVMMSSLFRAVVEFCQDFRIPFETKQKSSTGPAQVVFPNGSKWEFWSSETVVANSEADNARGLGSMEFSGATLEEADRIHKAALNTVTQRLRQKTGMTPRVIFYNLNPTDEKHHLAQMFMNRHLNEHPEDYHDFKFTMEDNAYWLPEGYIESQYAFYKRQGAGLFRRFILGEWGPEVVGTPYYGPYWDENWHISKTSFIDRWVEDQLWMDGDLCYCWDFGTRSPCLVVFQDVQVGHFSQIRVLYCCLGDNTQLGPFGKIVLDEVRSLFHGASVFTYADKQGANKDPRGVTDINAMQVLQSLGLNPIWGYSDPMAGIDLIINLLQETNKHKTFGTQPAIIVEPNTKYTGDFIDMMSVGYAQVEDAKGDKYQPVDNKYVHMADAFRYGIVKRRQVRRPTDLPPHHRPGWQTVMTRNQPLPPGMYLTHPELMDAGIDVDGLSAYYGFGDGAYEQWH